MALLNASSTQPSSADDSDALTVEKIEAETKRIDLSLKRLQLEQLERAQVNWSVALPVISGILAALIGVGSAVTVAYLNGQSQLHAERYKAQITLIVEAV